MPEIQPQHRLREIDGNFRVIEKTIDSSKPKCQVIGNRYVFNTSYRTLGIIREEPNESSSTAAE